MTKPLSQKTISYLAVILIVLVLSPCHYTSTVETPESTISLIILGNAGSGKSFLCNIILDNERFESNFLPSAVTTKTENETINANQYKWVVFNIPGLIEIDQEAINRNKEEIMKAFNQSSQSIVIFVWTQIGGRAQTDDIIAFNALNAAYRFPQESLFFVVNNLPAQRSKQYEGLFLATLSGRLTNVTISADNVVFIDTINPANDTKQREIARLKLIRAIAEHRAHIQKQHQHIILEADQLTEIRNELKQAQDQLEKDKKTFSDKIEQMQKVYEKKVSQERQSLEQKIQMLENKVQRQKKDVFLDIVEALFPPARIVSGLLDMLGSGNEQEL